MPSERSSESEKPEVATTRRVLVRPFTTDDALHDWVRLFCGLSMPRKPVCPHHQSPFDYLRAAYFEPTRDLVVWAPRGGGKTRLGAVATLLDLLHKPGCGVRILGGSLTQSLRLWEHLHHDIEDRARHLLRPKGLKSQRVELASGSSAAVLTQSQRAVRGLRVQKLRCDEVELFDPAVWDAAQLVTRSRGIGKKQVVGAIEAISTYHHPYGLMSRIVAAAQRPGSRARLIQWCLLEVLERCPPERDCNACPLWDDCQGVAKTRCDGYFSIDDAINLKHRVSIETWQSEMLCRTPSTRGCVFPSFDENVHVRPAPQSIDTSRLHLAMDFGFRSPFVCLWVLASEDGSTHVLDEYIQPQRTFEEHLDHIESRPWPKVKRVACDPAGQGRNEQTGVSNIALMRRRGYSVRTRRSGIVEGLELIRAALKPAAGKARLFIDPRCSGLIKSLRGYHYADGGSELPVKDGENDHAIDALRYFFVNQLKGGAVEVCCY